LKYHPVFGAFAGNHSGLYSIIGLGWQLEKPDSFRRSVACCLQLSGFRFGQAKRFDETPPEVRRKTWKF
jgi:hypothetical protein